jgi:hypothetical protein
MVMVFLLPLIGEVFSNVVVSINGIVFMVLNFWLLVLGYWFLVLGSWFLVVGCRLSTLYCVATGSWEFGKPPSGDENNLRYVR